MLLLVTTLSACAVTTGDDYYACSQTTQHMPQLMSCLHESTSQRGNLVDDYTRNWFAYGDALATQVAYGRLDNATALQQFETRRLELINQQSYQNPYNYNPYQHYYDEGEEHWNGHHRIIRQEKYNAHISPVHIKPIRLPEPNPAMYVPLEKYKAGLCSGADCVK